ncbi:MAG: RICIN domain-containing protein [Oscillospiraceae bacterium]|nr:RICIN domain-containing protein [Oscillospiraceae bacterium]
MKFKKWLSGLTSAALALSMLTVPGGAVLPSKAATANWKFDLGGSGAASGYTGVSASDGYSSSKGYGFSGSVSNVAAGGSGALSDAVQFSGGTFNVDLPVGLYQVTVTTGNSPRTSIMIENMLQMINLTGNNAVESIQVPVTDGQLSISAVAGMNNAAYTISAIEITQINTTGTMKPTVWICGDSTVANYYNVADSSQHGWGQYLKDYINTNVFEVRNQASSGQYAKGFVDGGQFDAIKYYGKPGDYYVISIGINDTNYSSGEEYYSVVTDMVKTAKNKGMNVILVKQQGRLGDLSRSPLLGGRWFGGQLDKIASEQNVTVIDDFTAWQDFGLSIGASAMASYYATKADGSTDDLHQSALGAKKNAEIIQSLMKIGDTAMDTSVYYTFKNTNSGLVMDVAGGTMAEGTNIQQWGSSGVTAQQFQLSAFAGGTDYYYIRSVIDPGYVLKAMTGSDGGNIELVPYSGSDSMMLFKFTKVGDGSYYISTRSSRDACFVEVASASKGSGANVQQWSYTYNACQNWQAVTTAIPEATEPATDAPTEPPTQAPTEPPVQSVQGDLNGDGVVNVIDLTLLKRSVRTQDTSGYLRFGDVNGSGALESADAGLLQRFLVRLEKVFERPAISYDTHYYAVDAVGVDGWEETTNAGFEGRAYWNFNNATGSSLTWTIDGIPADGDYKITFRYANGAADDRPVNITVNGEGGYAMGFPGTGAWTTWGTASVVLTLKKGTNTISLVSSSEGGGPNLDYLMLAPFDASGLSENGYYFAVDQEWEQGVAETTNAGYTKAEGYVNLDNNDTSNITFTVYTEQAGNYMTHIRFANGSADDRQMKVYVNGDTSRFWLQSFTGTGAWTTWTEFGIVLPLNKGVNTIKLVSAVADKGGPNLDYITLTLTDEPYGEPYDPDSYQQMLDANKPTIFIAGDSTVQTYRASYAPQQGWGYYLPDYFTDGVNVANHSIAGRSSKKFYDEGRWQTIADSMKAGDFVMIQFAINDAGKSNADRYAPVCGDVNNPAEGSYEWYMTQFIKDTQAKGGTPILVTTVIGMGAYNSSTGKFVNSYTDYCNACKSLASKYSIPCIDLNTLMVNHYNSVGYNTALSYHLMGVVEGSTDGTHFCETGANVVAGLVAGAVKNQKIAGLYTYVK